MDLPRKLRRTDTIPNAKWFNQLIEAIEARTILGSPDFNLKKSPNGVVIKSKAKTVKKGGGGTSAPTVCILGDLQVDSENSTEQTTKYKIVEGFLNGGGKTEPIKPDNLTAAIDDIVYLECDWTATKIDEVLQSGGDLGTVTVKTAASVPDDTIPTLNSLSGTAHIPLGQWVSNGETGSDEKPVWKKGGCGSLNLFFCPAQGFIYTRN